MLVADDSESNRNILTLRLEREGALVSSVRDGRSAVDSILAAESARHAFDGVLLDLQMPVMDGFEVAATVRCQGITVPLIALSAYASADDRDDCLKRGFDAFLTKPIDWRRLVESLALHARRRP